MPSAVPDSTTRDKARLELALSCWGCPHLLHPQGELPLSAIHINLEEEEKQIRSFLIEGALGSAPLPGWTMGRGHEPSGCPSTLLGLCGLHCTLPGPHSSHISVCQAVSSTPSVWYVPAMKTTATGCSAFRLSPARTGHPCCPTSRVPHGCRSPHR